MSRTNANSVPANCIRLRRILQQELVLGKQLLALGAEETEVLVAANVARLQEIECEQRKCIDSQRLLETARMTLCRELAIGLCLDRIPKTLAELLPALPTRDQEALAKLRLELLEVHRQLENQNTRNRLLLNNALAFVKFSLNAVTTAVLKPARYGANLVRLSAPSFYIDSKA